VSGARRPQGREDPWPEATPQPPATAVEGGSPARRWSDGASGGATAPPRSRCPWSAQADRSPATRSFGP